METIKQRNSFESLVRAALIAAAFGLFSCTGAQKKEDYPPPRSDSGGAEAPAQGGIEEVPAKAAETPSSGSYGPAPTEALPLTVVLGPGWARGLVHAGALQALQEHGIPIGMVVGVEVGALVAAMYSTAKSNNELDWSLQKVREELFVDSKLGLFKLFGGAGSTDHLKKQLNGLFGKATFNSTKLPIRMGVYSELENKFEFIGKGRLSSSLVVALSERAFFKAGEWFGAPSWASTVDHPFPVREAKALYRAPILVISTFNGDSKEEGEEGAKGAYLKRVRRAEVSGRRDLQAADLVIEPDMTGIGYFDFEKRSRAIFMGKSAIEAALPKIRQLVGISE